jgi:hypothetical protein
VQDQIYGLLKGWDISSLNEFTHKRKKSETR